MNIQKSIWFPLVLILLSVAPVYSQKIVNNLNVELSKIYIYTERDSNRNTAEFNPENRFMPLNINNDKISIDSTRYKKKLNLRKGETYTLKFVSKENVIYSNYGFKPHLSNKLVLDSTNTVIDKVDTNEYVDIHPWIYFRFTNSTKYSIYCIYSKVSDEEDFGYSLLGDNPDRKLISGEKRNILVRFDRPLSSYRNKTFTFKFIAIDENGKLHEFDLNGIDIQDENVRVVDAKSQ